MRPTVFATALLLAAAIHTRAQGKQVIGSFASYVGGSAVATEH